MAEHDGVGLAAALPADARFQLRSGLAAGLWPALRASRLDPIEALRYE